MQDVDPKHEQLPHELEPLVAAVSPNKDDLQKNHK